MASATKKGAAHKYWASVTRATSPVRTREEVVQVSFSYLLGVESGGSRSSSPMPLSAAASVSTWHSPWQARRSAIFDNYRWKFWEQQRCLGPSGSSSTTSLPSTSSTILSTMPEASRYWPNIISSEIEFIQRGR